MKIEITTNPSDTDARQLSDGIIRFNHKAIPSLEPEAEETRFWLFVRDERDSIQGGLRATCYWNTLHIELTWLAETSRGRGLGEELIAMAEAKAKELGCEKAFVETTSWQAKPFYERHGYTHVATLDDRPKGHSSHYLTKNLPLSDDS